MPDMQAEQMINLSNEKSTPPNEILGVKLSVELKDRIKALATYDGRTVSSFARLHLEQAVLRIESERSSSHN